MGWGVLELQRMKVSMCAGYGGGRREGGWPGELPEELWSRLWVGGPLTNTTHLSVRFPASGRKWPDSSLSTAKALHPLNQRM